MYIENEIGVREEDRKEAAGCAVCLVSPHMKVKTTH